MCTHVQNKTIDIVYLKFPKNIDLCNKWASLCHRFDLVADEYGKCNKSQRLCSTLFEPNCYLSSGDLHKDAISSIFGWTAKSTKSDQKDTSSTNICEMSASQNIVNETILDLSGTEFSVGIAVCSSSILVHTDSSIEITNLSGISRVACTSPITDDQLSQSLSSSCSTQTPKTL